MANLRANNLTGTGGRNAIDGSVFFGNTSDSGLDYLELADTADLEFGTGDYTVEFWAMFKKTASSNTYEEIVNKGYPFQIYRNAYNKQVLLAVDSNTSSYEINTSFGTAELDTWHHIAVSRSGNTTKAFLNGVEGLSSTSSTSIYDSSSKFSIGRYSDSSGYKFWGYVSNLRVVKGTALYTAAFTPPTEKLTAVAGTVLLCCQDSDDPTQEATGKTITGYGRYANTDTEVVTNPSFINGTTGWTLSDANEGSMAVTNGSLVLTNDDSSDPPVYAWQAVTLVVGQTYDLKVHFSGGTGTPGSNLAVYLNTSSSFGSAAGGSMTADSVSGNGIKIHRFKASAATTYLLLRVNANAAGTSIFSTASIKVANRGKAPKVLPPVGVDEGVTFDGDTKINSQGHMYFPTGDTSQRSRGRAVIWMGISDGSGSYTNNIDYIQIHTLGNSMRFGDLGNYVGLGAAISSSTRGVFAGGSRPTVSPASGGNQNFLEYVTIATTGGGIDFGGVSTTFRYGAGISNETRGLICGAYQGSGASGTLNTIQYLTIATTGDTLDFGDMVADGGTGIQGAGATSSSTRGITFGAGTPTTINEMNYITIGTLGNSVDFGDLSATRYLCQGVSDGTRGVVAGGDNSGAVNIIEYITIAATGNATDFGDLISASEHAGGTGGSNKIRGVFVGRGDWPAVDNAMSYITISSTGNAKDFGDIRSGFENYGSNALSDCHGGLS